MAQAHRQATQWREAPWTIKTYGALYLIGIIAFAVLEDRPLGVLFSAVIAYLVVWGMVRRSRAAWIVALAFDGVGVLGSIGIAARLASGADVKIPLEIIQVVIVVLTLVVLLHPRTREWCRLKLRLAE